MVTTSGNTNPSAASQGFTLVELLVTIVVAALVASSTYMFFGGQQRIYDQQTKVLNVQQNLWAAMETVARYVRAAGSGMSGCLRDDPDGAGALLGDDPPGRAATYVSSTAAYNGPQGGLRAYDDVNNRVIRIPPLWIYSNAAGANTPDELTVAYGTGGSGNWYDASLATNIAADTPTTAYTILAGQAASFLVNDLVILLDIAATPAQANGDRGCTLARITAMSGGNTLTHAGGSWNPASNIAALQPYALTGPPPALPTQPPAGTGGMRLFGQLVWVRFWVDNSCNATASGYPCLVMTQYPANTTEVLAEGIEDMQIAYGCDWTDTAGTGGADGKLKETGTNTDEWIYNNVGDTVGTTCVRPRAVRISLFARSTGNEDDTLRGVTHPKAFAEDTGGSGASDLYRHRVMITTVYPRGL